MKLLIWACSLCLVCNTARGMFFDAANDDFIGDAISGLNDYFEDDETETSTTLKPVTHAAAAATSTTTANTTSTTSGILDEMETSLVHATDKLDGLWQQFRKGFVNLMSGFGGSNDVDGHNATTTTGNTLQLRPIANVIFAQTTSTKMAIPTTTTTDIPTTTTELSTPQP